jgi:phosphatidylserine decarboxylase
VIKIHNRKTGKVENEKVLGGKWIEFAYGSPVGSFLTRQLFRRRWVSQFFGNFQNHRSSLKKIPEFIQEFSIPMQDFVEKKYEHFNDFFIRAFKPGMRPFSSNPKDFSAFAEGRYFVFDQISESIELPIKGANISLPELLGSHLPEGEDFKPFIGGALFLARLCPVDYHRFHFSDEGKVLFTYRIGGHFDSVNPAALRSSPKVLFENERVVSVLQTAQFGRVLQIEVGALMVGKIVQSFASEENGLGAFKKGEEKGYFLFGGSTVIVVTEKGKVTPSPDLLQKTKEGMETLVQLGETIGLKC